MPQHLSKAGRNTAWLLLTALSLCPAIKAQESPTLPGRQAALPRPEPLNAEVGIPPAIQQILQTWEQRSGEIHRMKGEFVRYEYDKVFATCKVAVGRYWYESPDKGRMDFSPDNTRTGKTMEKGGTTYTFQPADARSWICDGKEIKDIDIVKKEYNRVVIPEQFQGKNIGDGPLPFLFGMTAKKLESRYMLSLGGMHQPEKVIHLVAVPKLAAEQREYRIAEVMLDPQEYLPSAIQLLDNTGNKETVYVFSKADRVTLPFIPPPWNPPMIGFKLLHDVTEKEPLREGSKPTGTILR